ncbi:tRNA lysidine(34) synthetase TilS [Thalassovita sp.]|uniref:tRNA lysidine(34) synthetase TilS n=1 Tax=Thalassovita sp. TaxID=1979401 RepID=UPI0029DE8CD7|nr:tRNA lysidine(34) synthetase TilS [Thalassovita sp.]
MTGPRAAFDIWFKGWHAPVLGLAVSGGGDSIALLRLAVDWAKQSGTRLSAVTVDHGLRPEAAAEAAFVAGVCLRFGVSHQTLRWTDWDGAGNLQDRARDARYGLIADWARGQGIDAVALAHNGDDQAETFVMRLARSAGVDGLAAMSDRVIGGVRFVRPLLGTTRTDLRSYLTGLGQQWVDDPSNDDPTYERVRVRQGLRNLVSLGIGVQELSAVAGHMAQAREALNWAAHGFAQQHLRMLGPDVTIDRAAFGNLPVELRRRLLVHVLMWLTGSVYAPRRQPVLALIAAIEGNQPMTLHGCQVTLRKGTIHFCREYAAVKAATADPGQVWDGRWRLTGPATEGVVIAPLGQSGLRALPAWRNTGRPAAAVMADPAAWRDGALVAAPISGFANGWVAEPANGRQDCHSSLLTH